MKKAKGGNKQFSRYLSSQYEDISLTPLKPIRSHTDKFLPECQSRLKKKCLSPQKCSDNNHSKPTSHKTHQTSLFFPAELPRIRLDSRHISRCVQYLSSDAEKCDYGLCEFKYAPKLVENKVFRQVYEAFKTVPVLFLSISRDETSKRGIEAVFFWQINRGTPLTSSNYVCLDSRQIDQGPRDTSSSLLLLAKIVPEDGESITEARILGEDRLLVKSLDLESCEIVMRVYEVARLFHTMRINPYRHEVIANQNYSYKFRLSVEAKEDSTELTVFLWHRKELEDLDFVKDLNFEDSTKGRSLRFLNTDVLQSTETINLPTQDVDIKRFVSDIISDLPNNSVLLLDKRTATFLFWCEDKIKLVRFNEVNSIRSMKSNNSVHSILDQNSKLYELKLDKQKGWELNSINNIIPNSIPENFDFNLIQLENGFFNSDKMKQIVYFSQCKFHLVQLQKKDKTIPHKVILDLSEKIKEEEYLPWSAYQEPSPLMMHHQAPKLLILFFSEGAMHFYDTNTDRYKSVQIFLGSSYKGGKWKIRPTADSVVYLYDLVVKNLAVVIHTEKNLNAFFKEDYTPYLEFIQTFKFSEEFVETREWDIQVGGPSDKILLFPGESGSHYVDIVNLMYTWGDMKMPPLKEERLQVNENDDTEEGKMRVREAEIRRELCKNRKQIESLKCQDMVIGESVKALERIRENISRAIQNINKYDVAFREYNSEKNQYKKTRDDDPKELVTKDDLKEYLALYEEIKEIKRRENQRREKEKCRKKKDRYYLEKLYG